MKNLVIISFCVLLFYTNTLYSQYYCNKDIGCHYGFFDSTTLKYIELVDTTDNIWEYGSTKKDLWHYGDKVMITGLEKPYPPNNRSAFKVRCAFPRQLDIWWWEDWENVISIYMGSSIESDRYNDGGVVEISFDDSTWIVLGEKHEDIEYLDWELCQYLDRDFFLNHDNINCLNKRGFSGKMRRDPDIFISKFPKQRDSVIVYLKFTFCSDSIDNKKAGWLIDDFAVVYGSWVRCPGMVNDYNKKHTSSFLKIFPSPSFNKIFIESMDMNLINKSYTIYNYLGKEMGRGTLNKDQSIDISNLEKGIYILRIGSKDTVVRKFVKY